MTAIFSLVLYLAAGLCLLISWRRDQSKTKQALRKGSKAFTGILAPMLTVLLIIGLVLVLLTPETISRLIGARSGALGVGAAALIGSITLIPGFVAFPLAEALLDSGAGLMQITAFVSTLMMVGVVTLPMEAELLGRRRALLRNGLALIWSVLAAVVMGVVL